MKFKLQDFVRFDIPGAIAFGKIINIDEAEAKIELVTGQVTNKALSDLTTIAKEDYDALVRDFVTSLAEKFNIQLGEEDMAKELEAKIQELEAKMKTMEDSEKAMKEEAMKTKAELEEAMKSYEDKKKESEAAQKEIEDMKKEKMAESRFAKLSELGSAIINSVDADTAVAKSKLSEMSDAEFDRTFKMAEAFAKLTDQTQTATPKLTEQTESTEEKLTDQTQAALDNAQADVVEVDEVAAAGAEDNKDNALAIAMAKLLDK